MCAMLILLQVIQILRDQGAHVPDDYGRTLDQAVLYHIHARVYDPGLKKLVYLSHTPSKSPLKGDLGIPEDDAFLGADMCPSLAQRWANGISASVLMYVTDAEAISETKQIKCRVQLGYSARDNSRKGPYASLLYRGVYMYNDLWMYNTSPCNTVTEGEGGVFFQTEREVVKWAIDVSTARDDGTSPLWAVTLGPPRKTKKSRWLLQTKPGLRSRFVDTTAEAILARSHMLREGNGIRVDLAVYPSDYTPGLMKSMVYKDLYYHHLQYGYLKGEQHPICISENLV